tara:strand:+ start:19411 stop:20703 length:1293 start_codon:yes stop_codon:yes gene_type:complete
MLNNSSNHNKRQINVVGVHSLKEEKISKEILGIIKNADYIASPRILFKETIDVYQGNTSKIACDFYEITDIQELIKWIKTKTGEIIVFSHGDPLWYGIGRLLANNFPDNELNFYPSPTSMQLAFAKLGIPWQKSESISIHGRENCTLGEKLNKRPKILTVLTNPSKEGVLEVLNYLKSMQIASIYELWLFENLNTNKERIRKINQNEMPPEDIDQLHIIILLKKETPSNNLKIMPLFGIEDSLYKCYEDRPGLITKKHIRIQILSDLELPEKGIIWDIGAGVGSIGLEALRLRPDLKLIIFEKRLGSKNLILENAKRLNVKPHKIIEEDFLEIVKFQSKYNLGSPDRIIIGGGDNKVKIINSAINFIKGSAIIVIPIVKIEIIKELNELFNNLGWEIALNLLQTYQGISLGDGTRLNPYNPVYILKAKKI